MENVGINGIYITTYAMIIAINFKPDEKRRQNGRRLFLFWRISGSWTDPLLL